MKEKAAFSIVDNYSIFDIERHKRVIIYRVKKYRQKSY